MDHSRYAQWLPILDYTVEPLFCGHHWDPFNCPDFRISGVSLIRGRIAATGSQSSVHISGVSASRGSTIVEF